MKIALLANSQTKPTATKLSEANGFKLFWKRNNTNRFPLRVDEDVDLLIRWGCATNVGDIASLNKPKSILQAADKLATIRLLEEKGIPTLKLVSSSPRDFSVCFGRTRHHSRGRGIWPCYSPYQVYTAYQAGAEYFVARYRKTREYRVHVVSGMVLFVQEKIGDKRHDVWNKDNGFTFKVVPQNEWRKEIVEPAIQAVNALGLDFGAVDVLSDPDYNLLGRRPPIAVVCEVNTAPALEGYSLEKYSEYFQSIYLQEIIPETLQLEKKYAKSYRYKDYKLKGEEI